jgi:hypothetical protein
MGSWAWFSGLVVQGLYVGDNLLDGWVAEGKAELSVLGWEGLFCAGFRVSSDRNKVVSIIDPNVGKSAPLKGKNVPPFLVSDHNLIRKGFYFMSSTGISIDAVSGNPEDLANGPPFDPNVPVALVVDCEWLSHLT